MLYSVESEADLAAIQQRASRFAPVAPEKQTTIVVTAADLYRGEIKKLPALYDALLYEGLTIFVAKPKSGKSWLALQLAVAIAGGPDVAGLKRLETGPVLYAALEEPRARTMERLRTISPVGDWAKRLHFFYDCLPLMGGGAEQIESLIEQIKPRLLVLDTLTGVVKGGSGKRETDVFRSQYAEVDRIRRWAEKYKLSELLIHHTRKGGGDGVVESVAGTGGIAAAADTLWQLKRKPEGEGVLEIVGREVEERSLALRFGQDPFGWQVLGDDVAQLLSAERRQLLELLREDDGMTPANLAVEMNKTRASVRQMLKRMREDGLIRKQGGKYFPSLSMSHSVTEREKGWGNDDE